MTRREIPVEARRAVLSLAFGRCQYRGCAKQLVTTDPITGTIDNIGDFAHILPLGEGPRAEFKAHFPSIALNSAANLMLLCPDHHRMVDKTNIEEHPPQILFRMKLDKSILIANSITGLLELEASTQPLIADYAAEYKAAEIIDLFYQARHLGPKNGIPVFSRAESLMRSLLTNPFFPKNSPGELVLATEYCFTQLWLRFNSRAWRQAVKHVNRALRQELTDGLLFHLLSCSLIVVRDEFGVFDREERLSLISRLVEALNARIDLKGSPAGSAFLLLTKSALLRWRGRLESGPNQRTTYDEAQRCCDLSYEISRNPGCLMQSALIQYSRAVIVPARDAPKHQPLLDASFEQLNQLALDNFPGAIKYRPRVFRETYRFADTIRTFWEAAKNYKTELRMTAYILGEAAISEHYFFNRSASLTDSHAFLYEAISLGYGHARNVAAYIGCRGIIQPTWFKNEILDCIVNGPAMDIDWTTILQRVRDSLYLQEERSEPSFGISEAEFWNTLATVTGRTLKDHVTAVRLFEIAARHAEVSSGKFRSMVGLTREFHDLGDTPNYRRSLELAATLAKAYQRQVIVELRQLSNTHNR